MSLCAAACCCSVQSVHAAKRSWLQCAICALRMVRLLAALTRYCTANGRQAFAYLVCTALDGTNQFAPAAALCAHFLLNLPR
jgi:hypothetical protein